MAIGKPLRIQERLGVQQPVLSERFRAKELSTNVPVQKIPFAEYSIGMNNAKASFAVSDELINMVDAGVKAKVYHDNAVKDRKRLNLMEDWQNSDMQYQQDFAKAKTFEEQQDVISSYDAMQDQLTASWKQEMGDDLQSAKYLSSLRTGSRKQYSKFSTTSYQTLHKDTVSLHKTNMERTAQDLAKNKNSDYTSGVKSLQDSVTSLVGLGEFSAEEAALNLQTTTDKILTERSTLFAHDYAQNILNTGQDFPTEEELDIHMSNVTGIMLSPPKLALSREAFSDSFYKEMAEFNRAEKVEQAFTKKALLAKMTTFEQETAEYLLGLEGGVPSKEYTAQRVEKAKAFDTSWNPGYSKKVESDLNKMRWGTASPTQVEFFTEGDGRQLFPEAYHDLKAVEQRLRGMGDVGEKTILGIVQTFRKENDGISKELGSASKTTVDNVLNALRSDTSVFDPKTMPVEAWNQFGSVGMTMAKVFAQSKPLGLAYRKVQARLEADRTSNPPRGAFSDATMKLPVGQQLEELEKSAEAYIREEFGGILVKQQEEEEKLRQDEKKDATDKKFKKNLSILDEASQNEFTKMQKSRLPKVQQSSPKVQQRSPAEIRIERNEKLKSDFKTKMSKGDNLGAIGTALSRPLSDAVDKFNEMHEESKKTYAKQPTNLNDRKAAIKDMATASKNIKESMIGEAATNFAKAAGKDWDIAKDDVADTLSEMTNWLGSRLLHGLENDTIEKTPPPKPPESTVPPEVSQATPMQSTVGNPDMVQQVAQALAPVADAVFGGSTVDAAELTHTVAPGDTISQIARDRNLDTEALLKLNPDVANKDQIQVGQKIKMGEQGFTDYLKFAESYSSTEYDDPGGVRQTNLGYGIGQNKEQKALRAKMESEGASLPQITDAQFDLAVLRHTERSKNEYNKRLQPGDISYEDQPPIMKELLTELAWNSKSAISSKDGWPKLLKAAKRGDYKTVANEMYLDESKQGAKRRNQLRDEYFKQPLMELERPTASTVPQKTITYPPKKGKWSKTWKKESKKLPNTPEIQAGVKAIEEVEDATTGIQFDAAQAATKHIMASFFEKSGLSVPKIFTKPITEKTLSPEVLKAGGLIAYKALIEGRATNYQDMGDAKKLVYRKYREKGIIAPALEMAKSLGNAATTFGLTVGESAGVVVKNGNLYIEGDKYNFPNNFNLKGKNTNDGWLWLQKKMALLNLSDKNSQKIEINLGKVADIKKQYESEQRT